LLTDAENKFSMTLVFSTGQ